MLEQINPQVLQELHTNRLFLDHLLVLERIKEGQKIPKEIKVLLQPLCRKLLVIELTAGKEDYMITEGGKRLLETIYRLQNNQEIVSIQKQGEAPKEALNEKFEIWWREIWPGSDSFTWKNKTFEGSRSLRSNKVETRTQLTKIVAEGEYTIDQVMQGTKNHVERLKEQSFKDRQNRLTFLPSSERYLRLRQFEPWIDKPLTNKEENKMIGI